MELLFASDSVSSDYCVQKVKVVASYVGIELSLRAVTSEELVSLCPQARSISLQQGGAYLSQHGEILSAVAGPAGGLNGSSAEEKTEVGGVWTQACLSLQCTVL
jgi:hypothetical protein